MRDVGLHHLLQHHCYRDGVYRRRVHVMAAAALADRDLSPEAVELLRAGAAHPDGRLLTLRRDADGRGPALQELARLGYQRWVGWDPMITDAGRAAIGEPSESEARLARLRKAGAEHAELRAKRNQNKNPDARTAVHYRTWQTMGLVCVLVVKHRDKIASIECSRDGSYYPHIYLPTSKIVPQPEATDEFILACVPKWLAQRAELLGITLPLSPARHWTDEQHATWERLGRLRTSINTRIYFAHRRRSNFKRSEVA